VVGRPLSVGGPAGGQADAVVEGQHAGGDEGGDLAQRVAGQGHRLADGVAHRLPGHERGEEHGQLGALGAVERRVGVEEQRGQRAVEHPLGPLDQRPCVVALPRCAQSCPLSPLPGEHHACWHAVEPSLSTAGLPV
jgi:hypothetical protein